MTDLMRVTARWDGFSGGPGYSNFFFVDTAQAGQIDNADAAGVSNLVSFFLEGIKSLLPPLVKVTIQSDVAVVNSNDGKMVNIVTNGGFGATTGTAASGPYSAASGAVVTWNTAGVRRGRRVRGRTFLVPLANSANEADGTLAAGSITTLTTAATNLMTPASARQLAVFARPTTKGGTDGNWFPVSSVRVPDRVAVLRSRRA
jgi:hypothetical protein